jgi:hypothetical protein
MSGLVSSGYRYNRFLRLAGAGPRAMLPCSGNHRAETATRSVLNQCTFRFTSFSVSSSVAGGLVGLENELDQLLNGGFASKSGTVTSSQATPHPTNPPRKLAPPPPPPPPPPKAPPPAPQPKDLSPPPAANGLPALESGFENELQQLLKGGVSPKPAHVPTADPTPSAKPLSHHADPPRKKLRCPTCKKAFAHHARLLQHLLATGHSEGLQKNSTNCPTCKQKFNTPTALLKHLVNEGDHVPTSIDTARPFPGGRVVNMTTYRGDLETRNASASSAKEKERPQTHRPPPPATPAVPPPMSESGRVALEKFLLTGELSTQAQRIVNSPAGGVMSEITCGDCGSKFRWMNRALRHYASTGHQPTLLKKKTDPSLAATLKEKSQAKPPKHFVCPITAQVYPEYKDLVKAWIQNGHLPELLSTESIYLLEKITKVALRPQPDPAKQQSRDDAQVTVSSGTQPNADSVKGKSGAQGGKPKLSLRSTLPLGSVEADAADALRECLHSLDQRDAETRAIACSLRERIGALSLRTWALDNLLQQEFLLKPLSATAGYQLITDEQTDEVVEGEGTEDDAEDNDVGEGGTQVPSNATIRQAAVSAATSESIQAAKDEGIE